MAIKYTIINYNSVTVQLSTKETLLEDLTRLRAQHLGLMKKWEEFSIASCSYGWSTNPPLTYPPPEIRV